MDIVIRGIDPENVRDVDRCDGEFSIAQRLVPRVEAGVIVYQQYFTILEYRDTADQLLGHYCDVAAPLQKADDGYHLQDLVLDLWVAADGQTLELDWDEFEGALRAGLIPDDLGEKAADTLKWMEAEARTGRFPSAFIG